MQRSSHGKAVDWWSLGTPMFDMLTGAVSVLHCTYVCVTMSPMSYLCISKFVLRSGVFVRVFMHVCVVCLTIYVYCVCVHVACVVVFVYVYVVYFCVSVVYV